VIDWQLVCLAVIAVTMTVMTVIQVGVLLALAKSARQVAETATEIRQEIRPLAEKIHRIADDAARVASLALTQVERVDQAMTVTSQRLDQTLNVVQAALVGPVRQGAAVITAVRAALALLRRPKAHASGRDDEEALFVG
jgi:type IV secretory pathway VirB2 component (pilin)